MYLQLLVVLVVDEFCCGLLHTLHYLSDVHPQEVQRHCTGGGQEEEGERGEEWRGEGVRGEEWRGVRGEEWRGEGREKRNEEGRGRERRGMEGVGERVNRNGEGEGRRRGREREREEG